MLCFDPKGFVSPNAVAAVRQAQLLGAVTDVRQKFAKQSEQKARSKIINNNRRSKRLSFTLDPQSSARQGRNMLGL